MSKRRALMTPEERERCDVSRRQYQAANRERLASIARDRRASGKCKGTTHYRSQFTPEQRAAELAAKREHYQATREQQLAYAAEYRLANADRLRIEWQQQNRRRSVYFGQYRQRNKDRVRARMTAWREANRKRIAERNAEWTRNNPEKNRLKEHKRRALKQQGGGSLSADIVERLMLSQSGCCTCCGASLSAGYHIDHIVPISKGGTNTDGNVQLLTPRCNLQKRDRDWGEFIASRMGDVS